MAVPSNLPPAIRAYLNEFAVRSRRLAALGAAGRALTLLLAWMLLACAADRFVQFPGGVRLGILIIALAAMAMVMLPALLALWARTDWVRAAADVERRDTCFGQRLLTVTSRMVGNADYRGSEQILGCVVREVNEQLAGRPAGRLAPAREALGPWVAVALLVVLIVSLLRAPGLRFGDLSLRFLAPLADVAPVTTTQLEVLPGDQSVAQSRPLTIQVRASGLSDGSVMLCLSDDARSWSHLGMTPDGAGVFTATLASVDRDVHYYVTGGDARTRRYLLRVLRRPAVAQFRLRYEYPASTRLASASVVSNDGRIEAPAGTRVLLTVVATEPLKLAALIVSGTRFPMKQASDPSVWQASMVVSADVTYSVELRSTRDVIGSSPNTLSVHAVPDQPPQVRIAHGGGSLRLSPRDILPLPYEAIDDYAVALLQVGVQVNDHAQRAMPVPIWGDPRRQQDVFNLDLATWRLRIGDVLTVRMLATDTAGHQSASDPLVVLISPRSVDMDTFERIAQIEAATELARELATQLDEAGKAQELSLGQKDRHSAAFTTAGSREDRALSVASQTATLLRQALLRAIAHDPPRQLAVALAGWVDVAETEAAAADEAFRQSGVPTAAAREHLHNAAQRARQLQSQLAIVASGEQAAALLDDRDNLRQTEKRAAPQDPGARQRLDLTLRRTREEIDAQAAKLGLDPRTSDLDEQLHGRLTAEQDVLRTAAPLDVTSAVWDWSRQMQLDPQRRLGFEGRLSAAAQAEAIGPDPDLQRAADLDLASRAVGALTASARAGGRPADPQVTERLLKDLSSLLGPANPHAPPARAASEAAEARQELARLSGESELAGDLAISTTARTPRADHPHDTEDLAMQASAAAAARRYDRAADMDQSLVRRLLARPRRDASSGVAVPTTAEGQAPAADERVEHHRQVIEQEMSSARRLDDLSQRQQVLAQQIGPVAPPALAVEQQKMADQIVGIERQRETGSDSGLSNGRDEATTAVLAAQEQLAAMPQALADAQTAAGARRDTASQAAAAHRLAIAAGPDQRQAAGRAAAEADQIVRDATDRLQAALGPLSLDTVQALSERLEPYTPETDAARDAITMQLIPALEVLRELLEGDDVVAGRRAAGEARQAIETCQRELAAAQDVLVKRDPLVAARWFARAAADSLLLRPPDLGGAQRHQAGVSAALSRAWDQSIHRAATERLAAIPSMSAILGPPLPIGPGRSQIAQQPSRFSAAREWGRLRPQDGADLNPALRDSDPPGYEQALQLYFEALGNPKERK